jgi:hypothetical protein
MEDSIAEKIEKGILGFNAFSEDPRINTFGFYIGKVEVPVAVIKSIGINKIRVYRGFGKEVAQQRLNHDGRVLWNFEGEYQLSIIQLSSEGEALDMSLFHGKVSRGKDAQLYGFLMENIIVEIAQILA